MILHFVSNHGYPIVIGHLGKYTFLPAEKNGYFFFVFNQASYITKGLHSREVFLNRSEPIIAGVI